MCLMLRAVRVAAVGFVLTGLTFAQQPAEGNRKIAGGGITATGWQGKIDAKAEKSGQSVNDAKLAMEGTALHVTTGPAVAYWNPKNVAKGDYTVSATFNEPKFMTLNDHPHPYGIVIAGNDMGSHAKFHQKRHQNPAHYKKCSTLCSVGEG